MLQPLYLKYFRLCQVMFPAKARFGTCLQRALQELGKLYQPLLKAGFNPSEGGSHVTLEDLCQLLAQEKVRRNRPLYLWAHLKMLHAPSRRASGDFKSAFTDHSVKNVCYVHFFSFCISWTKLQYSRWDGMKQTLPRNTLWMPCKSCSRWCRGSFFFLLGIVLCVGEIVVFSCFSKCHSFFCSKWKVCWFFQF